MYYFNNFPNIQYNNVTGKNIILKAAIINEVLNKATAFYPYIIKEGYRPDRVAEEEYGNPVLEWVVYFSNNIVDPYYQWPMNYDNLKAYLEKKYNKTVYELQNQTSHYEYTGLTNDSANDIARKNWKMSTTTFSNLSSTDRSGWTAVSVYDYEDRLNEEKRSIQLLSPIYLNQVKKELSEIFLK